MVLRLHEGDMFGSRAHFGPLAYWSWAKSDDEPRWMNHEFRWMREHGTLHVPDIREQNEFPTWVARGRWRTSCRFLFVSKASSLDL